VAEKRVHAAADREKIALELANQTKVVVEVTKEQEAALAEREAAAAEREKRLAARKEEEVTRLKELQEREAAVEEELAVGTRRLQEREVALQEKEAKVEEFLVERSASIGQIVWWAGEVNPFLDALGATPSGWWRPHLHLAPPSRCWTPPPSGCETWSPTCTTSWRQKGEQLLGGWQSTPLPASGATTPPSS
jgi:hypothetical protein